MLRKVGQTFGTAMAVVCLASSLALAWETTCTKDDGKGTCTAALGADGQTLVVVGSGVVTGEKMSCADTGGAITCRPVPK